MTSAGLLRLTMKPKRRLSSLEAKVPQEHEEPH